MKRIIAGLALAFLAAFAHATTLNPVQLLNPAGSTSGQAIVSTGASSAPGWSTLGVANITGAAPLASPTFTGTVTAAALTATGAITPSQTAGIVGTTTNNNANAGSLGEYATNTTSGTSLSNGTPANATSISLTAGDWDVSGEVTYSAGAGCIPTVFQQSISMTSATGGGAGTQTLWSNTFGTASTNVMPTPRVRISLSATTTVYLVGAASFSGGTMTANGFIRARRVR